MDNYILEAIKKKMEIINLPTYQIKLGSIRQSLLQYLDHHTYTKIAILCDENTNDYCLYKIRDVLPSDLYFIQIKSGERHKTIQTCVHIWSELVKHRFTRHDLLINLGGGVIGDMGGFAAACFMRGIDFIQIPTTLLSQVDASVGGKLAIDFEGYKNMIGLFQDPKAVLIDPDFLMTLSPAELQSGFAEMIKHALIKDRNIWKAMTSLGHWKSYVNIKNITDSVNIKRQVVEGDPHERGLRKILNFGHTIGHAIESYSYDIDFPLSHGQAIAYGMIGEAFLSCKKTGLSIDNFEQIRQFILSIYGAVDPRYLAQPYTLIERMKGDKKNKASQIHFSLLGGIGVCYFDIVVSDEDILSSLESILR